MSGDRPHHAGADRRFDPRALRLGRVQASGPCHRRRVVETSERIDERITQPQRARRIRRRGLPAELRQLRRQQRTRLRPQRALRLRSGERFVEILQVLDHLLPDRAFRLLWQLREQRSVLRQRHPPRPRQRESVGDEAAALRRRQPGVARAQPREIAAVVLHAVVAEIVAVGDDRHAPRKAQPARFTPQHHPFAPAAGADAQRNGPARTGVGPHPESGKPLQVHVDQRATAAAGGLHDDQRHTRLRRPAADHRRQVLPGGLRQVEPEVVGGRVGIGVRSQVTTQAVAEDVGAEVRLEHAEHGPAFLVGDLVEHFEDAGLARRRRIHRPRRRAGVAGERRFEVEPPAQGDLPLRIRFVHHLDGDPVGERFVQPEVVPPCRGDQIAEPLVRELVGHEIGDRLALPRRGAALVEQQPVLVVGDQPPVFHRAAAHAGHRDLVELGQHVGAAEVVAEPPQHLLGDLHRIPGLVPAAARGEDAQRKLAEAVFEHVEFAHGQRDEIGRHRRRAGESRRAAAVRKRRLRDHRHVGQRLQPRIGDGLDLEGRAKRRLVERREQPSRVRRLQLRGQHPGRLPFGGVVDAEEALSRSLDLALVVDQQQVPARRQRRAAIPGQAPLAASRIVGHVQPALAAGAQQPRRSGGQPLRVDRHRRHRPPHVDLDLRLSAEVFRRRIDLERDPVERRHDVFRQSSRRGLEIEARGRRRRNEAGRQRERQQQRRQNGTAPACAREGTRCRPHRRATQPVSDRPICSSFAFSHRSTEGKTNLLTSPPSIAISRTMLPEMNWYWSDGVRNIVSTSGSR